MIEKRPFAGLGHANHGWLNATHHFSFAHYYDPARMGWGALRVWNDDEIAADSGFPMHPHANMEIITYVREGAITHRDSLGNHGRTEAGDVQVMSAGSGIRHSEHNRESGRTRLFQIWIEPATEGGTPSWGQRPFPREQREGRFTILASGIAGDDALPIRANARVLAATVGAGQTLMLDADPERHLYLVPATGRISVNGVQVDARDGLAITQEERLEITGLEQAELVLVDSE
ncbi:pirin family protein [Granulibacter bethesdensis]|uniref:Pirin n=2 Tax=Granulibacter bethesdensis TaxID=364410 RepID=Q0BQN8_GRABC|nr:pirin family protein [Granulibacter bethesdensis]ABI62864.1 Pirin [Granulibacter bethesdensis CGDNIH1]AHJ63852.1 Pirin [Granulibacter bethesdensis]AHJ68180.1 Pirin [Granulibacter bethesdensis]APH52731.1 Pirin [Granulibacter bethesdensis]APH60304.1 Pirin [Granulibacter bethesdensis]